MADKVEDQNTQTVTLTVVKTDYTFNVDRKNFNELQNGLASNPKKHQAWHNFVMACINPEQKESLAAFISATPSSETQLGSYLFEQYTPDIDIVVKKH